MPNDDLPDRALVLKALATDLVCVVLFCTIGRRSHAEGLTLSGIAETAWPFLTGTAAGWVLARAWQRPASLAPTGLVVWAATVVVGMLLRKVTGQGTAVSFIVVASLTTAVLLLGWRAAARVLARRSSV
ncbi:DUF3054 domain-containing protein [Mycobacterium sp. ITM-2016-00317]|uniref:DUF3054 domain-containing protein n=1 Tax=Mycobacterium sp. ITM-2016-00317 TaxID=2099694 RepID=UPI00287FDDDE|nr:DUF3054 domain-containing protein [Mycobacterium sp. ITM-2016-00317]WNG87934.1 DUF3054 domain-containing protein [Mycobacterium sp. ITM-2016-00317]